MTGTKPMVSVLLGLLIVHAADKRLNVIRADQGRTITSVTDAMLLNPDSRRLAELAPDARRLGIQPAQADHDPERPSTAARLVVGAAAGPEPADAARRRTG